MISDTFEGLKEIIKNKKSEDCLFISIFSFLNDKNPKIYSGEIEGIIEGEEGKTGKRNGVIFSGCYIFKPEVEDKIYKNKKIKTYIYEEKWDYIITDDLNEFEKYAKNLFDECGLDDYIEIVKESYKKI